MKKCPACNRTYADETLTYCLADGSLLSAPYDPEAIQRIPASRSTDPPPTEVLPSNPINIQPIQSGDRSKSNRLPWIITGVVSLSAAILIASIMNSSNKSDAPKTVADIPSTTQNSNKPSVSKVQIPTNVALNKPVSIVTNGADDNRGVKPADVTDGSLEYVATGDVNDSCIGWQNYDYGELMVVNVTIDLQQTYNISKIRYNMGNVTRAESWNADTMVTSFGLTKTNQGASFSGAWTEQTGSLTASSVTITLKKARTSANTDWLFIGEIEVIGTPTG